MILRSEKCGQVKERMLKELRWHRRFFKNWGKSVARGWFFGARESPKIDRYITVIFLKVKKLGTTFFKNLGYVREFRPFWKVWQIFWKNWELFIELRAIWDSLELFDIIRILSHVLEERRGSWRTCDTLNTKKCFICKICDQGGGDVRISHLLHDMVRLSQPPKAHIHPSPNYTKFLQLTIYWLLHDRYQFTRKHVSVNYRTIA